MQHCSEEKDVLLVALWNPHFCEGRKTFRLDSQASGKQQQPFAGQRSWVTPPSQRRLSRFTPKWSSKDLFCTLFLVFQGIIVFCPFKIISVCMHVSVHVCAWICACACYMCMHVCAEVSACMYVYRCMHVHEYLCMCECVYLCVHICTCTSMCHGGVIEVKRQLSRIGFLLQLSVLGVELGSSSLHSKHLYFPGCFLCLTFPPSLLSFKKKYWLKSRFE